MKGWVDLGGWLHTEMFYPTAAVTCPNTNSAQCRATSLIGHSMLPLWYATNPTIHYNSRLQEKRMLVSAGRCSCNGWLVFSLIISIACCRIRFGTCLTGEIRCSLLLSSSAVQWRHLVNQFLVVLLMLGTLGPPCLPMRMQMMMVYTYLHNY